MKLNVTLARIVEAALILRSRSPNLVKWLTPSALLSAMTKFITMKFAGH